MKWTIYSCLFVSLWAHAIPDINTIVEEAGSALKCESTEYESQIQDGLMRCNVPSSLPRGYQAPRLDCSADPIIPVSFSFTQGEGNPHLNVVSRYSDGATPGRFFSVNSKKREINETYLILEEYAGGPDSHDVKSYMFLLPRVVAPSLRKTETGYLLTLPTGETVNLDKNSNTITGGAMAEGPLDLTTDRFKRKPPNIRYTGAGISIRLDHRFEHPLTHSATATITQGSRTCTVPRSAIFNNSGKIITNSDAELVAALNGQCRTTGAPFRVP